MTVHFWARLEFVSESSKTFLESHEDLSKAPWRPSFFYPDVEKQGFMIFPVAREGDEYGMFVLSPDFWENVHRQRIKPGVEFTLGAAPSMVMAKGMVTRLGQESG